MLQRVETEAKRLWLQINTKKTEAMIFNQDTPLITLNGSNIKTVENFKYLGGWMMSSEKDFEIRKALAWTACNKLKKIWTSSLSRNLKVRLFLANVESVLLYGSETWTINKTLEKRLDGCYTRMLRTALNVSWRQKIRNEELYGELPPVSSKVASRRLKLAGHCIRHPEEEASKLVLWKPTRGKMSVGRRAVTYVDVLLNDTGLESTEELKAVMKDRKDWRKRASSARQIFFPSTTADQH